MSRKRASNKTPEINIDVGKLVDSVRSFYSIREFPEIISYYKK